MGESRAEVEAETVERVARLVTTAGATLKEKKRLIKVVARDGTVKKVVPHVKVIEGLLHHEGISGELQAGVRPKTILCEVCKCVVEVGGGTLPKKCKKHRGKKLCPRGCGKTVGNKSLCCVECKTPEELSEVRRKLSAVGRKRMAAMTPEQRKQRSRKMHDARPPGAQSEFMRKRMAAMTPEQRAKLGPTTEQRREAAKKMNAKMTAEQRSERSRLLAMAMNAKSTKEQRTGRIKKLLAVMTPEKRGEATRKANAAMTPEQRSDRMRKAWETRRAKKAAAEKAGEE